MQMIYLAILFLIIFATVVASALGGVYLYRLGFNDNQNGNTRSALLPQIPKKPKLSREQLEKIEEQRQLRREGFDNMIKYMNGEE